MQLRRQTWSVSQTQLAGQETAYTLSVATFGKVCWMKPAPDVDDFLPLAPDSIMSS